MGGWQGKSPGVDQAGQLDVVGLATRECHYISIRRKVIIHEDSVLLQRLVRRFGPRRGRLGRAGRNSGEVRTRLG